MTHCEEDAIKILKHYAEVSSDEKQHPALLKEQKCVAYAAISMESSNTTILKLCLNIMENFISNSNAQEALLSTFGVYESLESLAIRTRKSNEDISRRASEITEILRNSAPPAYRTRSRTKRTAASRKQHTVYLLYIEGLTNKNRHNFEKVLLKQRGVISFIIDLEQKRCTLRICPKLKIRDMIEAIVRESKMKPLIVTKNIQDGVETFCDVLEDSINKTYIEYQTDDEATPKGKAISAAIKVMKSGNSILKSLGELWNESFYW